MNFKFLLLITLELTAQLLFSQTTTRAIRPADTDPLITTFNTDSHYVYRNTSVADRNLLVVHLPGSFGEPKRATLFGSHAAALGFHSIGLMYPNVPTVGSFCSNSSVADCFEMVRREIVEGTDYASDISIAAPESILNRVQKLLIYLRANYPSENWGIYLDANDNLIYPKIIFSGHSQGGGHAALIAKFYPIQRALCFSSPKDWRNLTNSPPLWLSPAGWQTTPDNLYCFNHTLDVHTQQLEIWDSLGIDNFGPPVQVENSAAPYAFTRQLTTSYSVTSGDEHASTIQDNKTPKVAGVPVFQPVWTYMLTEGLTSSIPQTESAYPIQPIPNPTSGMVRFDLPFDNYLLQIKGMDGRMLMQQSSSYDFLQLDLSELPSGLYFYSATGNQNRFTGKLIRQ